MEIGRFDDEANLSRTNKAHSFAYVKFTCGRDARAPRGICNNLGCTLHDCLNNKLGHTRIVSIPGYWRAVQAAPIAVWTFAPSRTTRNHVRCTRVCIVIPVVWGRAVMRDRTQLPNFAVGPQGRRIWTGAPGSVTIRALLSLHFARNWAQFRLRQPVLSSRLPKEPCRLNSGGICPSSGSRSICFFCVWFPWALRSWLCKE